MSPSADRVRGGTSPRILRRSNSGLRNLRLEERAWVVLLAERPAERVELTSRLLTLGCQVEAPSGAIRLADWVADLLLMPTRRRWPDLIILAGGRPDRRDLDVIRGLRRAKWPTAFLLAGLSRRQARRFNRLASGRVLVADATIEPDDLLTAACWLLEPPRSALPMVVRSGEGLSAQGP